MPGATLWTDLDDSSSFTGTTYSSTTSSTVLGPGAITGKFLKTVGERSLDLIVSVIIRMRLGTIERILEKNPRLLRNPIGDKEWERLSQVYTDLHELCRESRSEYYALSTQRAAANLISDIALITRPAPEFFIDASPTNEKWEALLARVQRRRELFANPQKTYRKSGKRDSISSFASLTNEKWESLLARVQRRGEPESDPQDTVPRTSKRDSNSSCLEPPELPTDGDGIKIDTKPKLDHSQEPAGDRRSRRASTLRGSIFKRASGPPEGLDQLAQPYHSTRKVLVLGAGGVGKSTLVKQIQTTVHEFSSRDAEPYGDVIFNNLMDAMKNILDDVDPLDLSENSRGSFQYIMGSNVYNWAPSSSLGEVISTLWHEPAVRRSARRAKLGMLSEPGLESADYFFDSAQRIFAPDYDPTYDDVVRSRIRTTGIWESSLDIRNSPWLLIDTGGERSERKKWVNCFENVTAVLFVVALSDYNKVLYEHRDVNRMEESLALFKSIVNSPWFTKSLIVLLFNKVDAFVETLDSSPLRDHFFDYTGETPYDACQYFEHLFISLVEDKTRSVITKYTCAVRAEATADTFQSVQDEINRHHERSMHSFGDI